jgi:hypothetical protein
MRKVDALFVLLSIAIIFAQPTLASQSKCAIHVIDKYGDNVENAYVRVWQNDIEMDYGSTDYDGILYVWLDSDLRYHITADKLDKYGEWNGLLRDRINITID